MKKITLAALAAVTLLSSSFVARPAQAAIVIGSAGYVCRVEYDSTTGGSGGSYGTVKVNLTTQGGCGGSVINDFTLYSTGSSASGPKFREQALMHNYSVLRDAATNWTRVNFRYESSNRAVATVLVFSN